MGATAAVYAPQPLSLADQAKRHMKIHNMGTKEFGKVVGYSHSVISRYVNGTYTSDPTNVEIALTRFFEQQEGGDNILSPFPVKLEKHSGFYETQDARGAIGVCQACQQDVRMGIVVGKTGYGKSFTLQQYAKLPRVAYIESNVFMGPKSLTIEIEKALRIPTRPGSVHDHMQVIISFFEANPGYLLIIDEADKLISRYSKQKIEILRGIYDKSPVGIVLAGEEQLTALIQCYLPQTENRAIYYSEMMGLTPGEVDEYLAEYDMAPEVLQAFRTRACGLEKSCFRLLEGTLSAIIKEMNECGSTTITMDIYKQATHNMMIR